MKISENFVKDILVTDFGNDFQKVYDESFLIQYFDKMEGVLKIMAFYAELKRRNWYCVCGANRIIEYKFVLYHEWYNSLTEKQKVKLEEKRKRQEEQKQRELNTEIAKIVMTTGMLS